MTYVNLYPEHLTAIGQILEGLNKLEGLVNFDHQSPGMNALLAAKLPIISDCDELLGFAVDEIGGIWSFLPATPEDVAEWNNKNPTV